MDIADFCIPLNQEELASHQGDSYYVREIFEPIHIDEKLEDCDLEYRETGPTAILTSFDTFYSILHHMNRLKDDIIHNAWNLLIANFTFHVSSLPIILDPEGIDPHYRKQQLNVLKMESYILTQFIESFENDLLKPGMEVPVGNKKTKKSKKSNNFEWSMERKQALHVSHELMQLEIQRLWDPPIVEEEFTNLFSNICYKILENPSFVKQKDDRDVVFQILGQLIKRFNHRLGATFKIIQLLRHFEHLSSPLAHAMHIFVGNYDAKFLVGDVIREIGTVDTSEAYKDTSSSKAFSHFIVEMADKIPTHVLPNISLLMAQLDGESYTMRNGVLSVLGELIVKVLSKDEMDETMKKSRESFLNKLEEHIHDVHAFVRSKVCQIWIHLFQEKVVPISRQGFVVDLIVGRLYDKSSNVRKYAVQFLKTSLISNPFGAKLTIDQLTSTLEKEMAKLAEMKPDKEDDIAPLLADDWPKIVSSVRIAIKDFILDNTMTDNDENIVINEDEEDAFHKYLFGIQKELRGGEYGKAMKMVSMAIAKWSEEEELLVDEGEIEALEQQINEDKSSSEDSQENTPENTPTEDTADGKEKALILKYEVLVRKIYLMENLREKEAVNASAVLTASQSEQPAEQPAGELMLENEIEKQKVLVGYLKSCLHFATQMCGAIPILCKLLGSKATTDILETIDFFIAAHEFGLAQSVEGIRKMANLIWTRDPVVKKAVINAFERLYIDVACDNPRNKPALIVDSLIALLVKANLGELTSLEKLICELMAMELIPQSVINLLWQKFALKLPQTSSQEQRFSIQLLSMIAGAEKDIIKSNLTVLIENGLTKKEDLYLARDTCIAILKLIHKKSAFGNLSQEPFRLPSDHSLFTTLELMMIQHITCLEDSSWTPFAEQALMVIYQVAESPDTICSRILKLFLRVLMSTQDNDVNMERAPEMDDIFPTNNEPQGDIKMDAKIVARVIFAVGHIALLQLHHLDVSVFSELKRRHQIKEAAEEENKGKKDGKTPSTNNKTYDASASKTMKSEADDDMGVSGAAAEDAEAEYIRKICEHEIVTGTNLLSLFTPLIVTICSNPTKYKSAELQTASTMALAKYMLVSSEFCDKHLQLLFTRLEKSELPTIRSNTIVALGDMTMRFPNLIEPWTPHLYARLTDNSVDVRKTAVTILSHLILNDMVKVKGQISEMAICLEDKAEKISSNAKMFFFELAQKGNALYNIAPDIISRLADPSTGVEEEKFRSIMKYLLQFIQKDKQAESMVEKLCHRFRATKTDRQWRDLSYCLTILPYNEKTFKKLQENIVCYRDKLADEDVYNNFLAVISKSKKFCKVEFKTMIDDFEKVLQAYHAKGLGDNADMEDIETIIAQSEELQKKANEEKKKKVPGSAVKPKQRKPSSRPKKITMDSDDDDDFCEKENKVPAAGKRRQMTRAKKTTNAKPIFSSDEEDD